MSLQLQRIDYQIYPSLLDAFTNYTNSDTIWSRYWGFSENPPHTPEEFRQKQFQSLVDAINRVPFESIAADRGTAFNELIDALVEHREPADGFTFESVKDDNGIKTHAKVTYKGNTFAFPTPVVLSFVRKYQGALCQQRVEGVLPSMYGNVLLYGYADEIMPLSVHDIKTTGTYEMGKFRHHAQHLVYPYCLQVSGNPIREFTYDVLEISKYDKYAIFTEHYTFKPDRDIPALRLLVEDFISFLLENKKLITNKKIFNQDEN